MSKKKVVLLFLCVVLTIGISTGIFRSIFNNYLKEIYSFTSVERGFLFTVALFAAWYVLRFLTDETAEQ